MRKKTCHVLRSAWPTFASFVLVVAEVAQPAQAQLAQTLQFQATDLKALGFVTVRDVNARGDVLGWDGSGRNLLLSQGKISTLDLGNFVYLNDAGQVAGSLYNRLSNRWENKLYSNGVITSLNVPGSAILAGFNQSGQMLAVDQPNGKGYFGTNENLIEFDAYWMTGGYAALLNNTGLIVTSTGGNILAFRVSQTGEVHQLFNLQRQSHVQEYDSQQFEYSFGVAGINDRDHIILREDTSISCSYTWAAGPVDWACESDWNYQNSQSRYYSLFDLSTSPQHISVLGGVNLTGYDLDYGFGVGGLNNNDEYVFGDVYGQYGRLSDGSIIAPETLAGQFGIGLDWLYRDLTIGDSHHMVVSGQNAETGEGVLLLMSPVPEPSIYMMLIAGACGFATIRRRAMLSG